VKNLFQIIPDDFFKPLTSKYKQIYVDCILLIFNTFKPEISYGVNREIIAKALTEYFEIDDEEMSFDEMTFISDARDKANGVILMLKNCGWIEYEQEVNHQLNVVLLEYAVPIIDGMNKVIREEEAEYQGIISQIHASLQNQDLYSKPYELIIKGVQENTERLISELKKLNVSIKRHMDAQTNEMDASEILDHFFEYHQNIGSKAYLRMKTSENIAYFRMSIIEKIDDLLGSYELMERTSKGYMEVEQYDDYEEAYDNVVGILIDIKSSFYRLDDIIAEIDSKHNRYMRNAVMRARFLLSTGNNLEGKLSQILNGFITDTNSEETQDLSDEVSEELQKMFAIFPQNYISPESLKTIPVTKNMGNINQIDDHILLSEEDRLLYKEALKRKNQLRFSRKNINEYVGKLLEEKDKMNVTEIPVESRRDLIRIIYISIYAGNRSNNYRIKRTNKRVKIGNYELPDFEIERAD